MSQEWITKKKNIKYGLLRTFLRFNCDPAGLLVVASIIMRSAHCIVQLAMQGDCITRTGSRSTHFRRQCTTRYDSNWETLATGEVRHLRRLIRVGWTPVAVIMIDGPGDPPVAPASEPEESMSPAGMSQTY